MAASNGTTTKAQKATTIADLDVSDLVDQETSTPKPLGAQTDELLASVTVENGFVVLKVVNKGMVGVEPVALRADTLSELRTILDDLDKQATERIKDRA